MQPLTLPYLACLAALARASEAPPALALMIFQQALHHLDTQICATAETTIPTELRVRCIHVNDLQWSAFSICEMQALSCYRPDHDTHSLLYPTLPSGDPALGSKGSPSQISIAPGKLSSARVSTCSTKRFLASTFLLSLMMSCSGSMTTHWWTTSLCKDSKSPRDASSCSINLFVFSVPDAGNGSLQHR